MKKEFYTYLLKKLDNPAVIEQIDKIRYNDDDLHLDSTSYIKVLRVYARYKMRGSIDFEGLLVIYGPISLILFLISSMLIECFKNSEIVSLLSIYGRAVYSISKFPKDYYYAIIFVFFIILKLQFFVFIFLLRKRLVIFYIFKSFKCFLLYYRMVFIAMLFIILWLLLGVGSERSYRSYFDLENNYFQIIYDCLFISFCYMFIIYRLTNFNDGYFNIGINKLEDYFEFLYELENGKIFK